MKITDVETIPLRTETPNIGLFDGSYDDCVIVIHTDEGLTGLCETELLAPAIQAITQGPSAHSHARGLKEVLLGCDPSDPEELWKRMYEGTDYARGLVMHAIGALTWPCGTCAVRSKASLFMRYWAVPIAPACPRMEPFIRLNALRRP